MALELRSTIKTGGSLEITLAEVEIPEPKDNQVVVRVEATPINPSDLGLLFGAADMTTARFSGDGSGRVVTADVPEGLMNSMAGRLDQSLPVGNEGAGVVVKAGASDMAQALMGKTVSIIGGAMYAEYKAVRVDQCLEMPAGVTPAQGASWFVNPMTAQGMVETMRAEDHTALLHTAAASNLGQMLVKICLADGVDLVNIVRKPAQADLLKGLGAKYVCDTSSADFMDELTEALVATGATIGFDAIGGGRLAGQILTCMEVAANRTAKEYSRYGSTTYKQVYIYGGLDRGPTEFNRGFGMMWGVGGWLLTPFLQKGGGEVINRLRQRVAAEITTTFASHYTQEVSLTDMLTAEAIAVYGKQATGEKFLVTPNS
ncbi:MAG: zinc-binding dehydrogenase [Rhodospirillaceae bacterium]|jgi:NADPH:quinone reductase|nr:zinc-binding dehydrogenase [Rhodospirillaceae bacterium]MBT5896838.1 zinc-binding dehydrogenase [Rhodospirillaceae bacterium]MBT6429165.1 zinc-binding dehydrogenase [Rhodospirillaceae bacterium]MBT7755800.1 zinc-binding dehydrogenase [Rhodospirillaceae bacterium]